MKAVLRNHIKNANLQEEKILNDCSLVIDAHSFFKDSYRDSGCQFIVGPECDRYAKYLVNKLISFQKCKIKCYVIFKGTTKQDLDEKRELEKHQKIINELRNVLSNHMYFEPLLVREVQREVLDALNINYFCCEYDSTEAILGVAKEFKCPVVTNNVEYCLFGVSCIMPKNISYQKGFEMLECTMYEYNKYKSYFGLYNKMPILLTLVNVGLDFSDEISEWSDCKHNADIRPLFQWTKRQRENAIANVSGQFVDENKRKVLMKFYKKIQILYYYPTCTLAVKYFKRTKAYGLFKDDRKWLSKGVATGRIAVPFVDIKRKGFITGSSQIYDETKRDALEAAMRIIAFSRCILTNSQTSTLDFIGRKNTKSCHWQFNTSFKTPITNSGIFTRLKKCNKIIEQPFSLFIKEVISDEQLRIRLDVIMPNCKLLCFTLVYYVLNIDKDFIDAAYFIFLSYLMIAKVEKFAFKKDEVPFANSMDYKKIYDELYFLFDEVDLKHQYNINIIHSLVEFQHCLQYMNYLNKLCGSDFLPTCYSATYNATFIYNAFVLFNNKDNLMIHLKSKYEGLEPFKTYVDLVSNFHVLIGTSPGFKGLPRGSALGS